MKRGSPTGFEVRIGFIVMFCLECGLVVLGCFGKKGAFLDARQTAEYQAICRRVIGSRCLLRRVTAEPLLETRWAEACVVAGGKALIIQFCAEVQGVDVRGDLPWVSRCVQETPGEFIHSDWFGTTNLDCTV